MKEETISILKKYHQEHILEYNLTEKQQQQLEKQILSINFEQLQKLYENTKQAKNIEEKKIEHIAYTDKAKMSKELEQELTNIGTEVIKQGHYAVITMAGGQGTRLGHQGPKGTYALDTIKGKKYIFEIIIDKLKKAKEEYGVAIPWYVMTSKDNHEETVWFLEKNKYIENIVLHFDNDRAGREATKALIIALNKYNVYDIPAPYGKDINDYLCFKLGLKKRQEIEQYKMQKVQNKECIAV